MNLWPNSSGEAQSWVSLDSELAHLQNLEIGQPVGPIFTAVLFHVLDPLDMGLGIAVHLAEQFHVTAHHSRGVGWESCLKDGPVRGPLWG